MGVVASWIGGLHLGQNWQNDEMLQQTVRENVNGTESQKKSFYQSLVKEEEMRRGKLRTHQLDYSQDLDLAIPCEGGRTHPQARGVFICFGQWNGLKGSQLQDRSTEVFNWV